MNVKELLISMVLFSMVMVGIAVFAGDLTDNYSVSFSEDFSSYQSYINKTSDISEGTFGKIINATQEKNVIQVAWYSLIGTKDIMLQLISVPVMLTDITSKITGSVGLPTEIGWLPAGITAIILIIVVFAIIKMIFKVEV